MPHVRLTEVGGEDIEPRPQTLPRSPAAPSCPVLGWRNVPLCAACDDDELRRSTPAGGPLAADHRPAAVHPRPPADTS